jgi:hypothetical protein
MARRGKIPAVTGPGAETPKIEAPMAGVGATCTGLRIAGAEVAGRLTFAGVKTSADLVQSGNARGARDGDNTGRGVLG